LEVPRKDLAIEMNLEVPYVGSGTAAGAAAAVWPAGKFASVESATGAAEPEARVRPVEPPPLGRSSATGGDVPRVLLPTAVGAAGANV